MTERKGLLLPEQEDFVATAMDGWFKFKNPIIETWDKTAFKLIIQSLDNMVLDKIKDSWKEEIYPIIDAAMAFDVEKVRELVDDLGVKHVNTKFGDEIELQVFDSFTRFIVSVIQWYIEKKKSSK